MLAASIPPRFPIPFANSASAPYIRAVPTASQIGITNGAASLTDGFPPLTMTPTGAGGVPPFGQDTNGILKQITQWCQWVAAGAPIFYDAAFSTSVNGYPLGAILTSSAVPGLLWRSTADNNTTNPDSVSATNWTQISRISLFGPTTFFINPLTGNDTTGTGTSGSPWATLQHAFDTFRAQYDFRNYIVTLQLADGTYTPDANLNGSIPGLCNPSNLVINGNSITPSNVIYNGVIGLTYAGAMVTVQNFKMSGNYGVASSYGATITIGSNMVWGPMAGYHIYGNTRGNLIINGNYSIVGGATAHISMLGGSYCSQAGGLTWTLSGTPGFGAFALADGASVISCGAGGGSSYSGSATGTRAEATASSLIYQTGGNPNFFPGNSAVITATQGQYL